MGTGRAGREPDGFSFQLTWTATGSCLVPQRLTHGGFCYGKRASKQPGNSQKAPSQQLPLPRAPIFRSYCPVTHQGLECTKASFSKVLRQPYTKGVLPQAAKSGPLKQPHLPALSRTGGCRGAPRPSPGQKHHVLLGRDGDDPLSMKSSFFYYYNDNDDKSGEAKEARCGASSAVLSMGENK